MANEKRLIDADALIAEYDRVHIGEPGKARKLMEDALAVQKWIPVTERLPEERDSIFAKFYGTERWTEGMFLKISKDVLACVEYEDGTKAVKALHTNDGKWHLGFKQVKVTHWMPIPPAPKGE